MTRTPDHTHLAALHSCIQPDLRQAITDHLNGQPKAQHYDSDKTTGGQGSDPTATTATTPDQAAEHLKLYDDQLKLYAQWCRKAYNALLPIAALSDKYLPTHEPKRRQIIADTKGCQLHERAGIDDHHPARCTTDFASVLDTPLREPIPVCHACQDFTRRNGQLPTTEQIIRHNRTGKWTKRTTGKRATVFTARQIADEWDGAA